MIYINLKELADICGYTYATAKTYYYRQALPVAIVENRSAKWLIDDVMVYNQSLIKQGKAKKTKKVTVRNSKKASAKSEIRAVNLKWHSSEYLGGRKQQLFMLFLFAHIKVLKNDSQL